MRTIRAGLAGVLAGAMTLVALGGVAAAGASAATTVEVRGSVEQVYATGLKPGARMKLVSPSGKTVATKPANAQGGLLFRRVKPGSGYVVKPVKGGAASPKVTVLSPRSAPPDTSVYDQEISSDGYGYLTTRDGTKLAINVHPPTDVKSLFPEIPIPELPTNAPRPVLIEYAGYGYADPAGPESGISLIANVMGFTVVNVNMRGTGCSGGAFDFFETLQSLDGYDIVETIARQPWTANGKVGMMGISYGGISQLFTAQTNPPSLAAIAPLSVLDSTQTTLYPGGILNTGFALEWAKDRVHDALPASPDGGQAWAWKRIQEGDQTCAANQAMHGEAVDLLRKIRANDHYKPKVADPLAPITFVDEIKAPTFMACQFTDEQTGGHCPTLASRMTGTDRKWFTFTNGVHTDSLDPETFNRWYDFMKIYVAREAPALGSALIRFAAPLVYEEAFGIGGVSCRPTRSSSSRATRPRSRHSSSCPPFDSFSTTAPAARRVIRIRDSSSRSSSSRCPAPRGRAGIWAVMARCAHPRRARVPTASPGMPTPARRRTSAATPGPVTAASGRRPRRMSGRRARRARPSPTSRPRSRPTRPRSARATCARGSAPARRASTSRRP